MDPSKLTYQQQQTINNELRLRELRKELPSFCDNFFRGIEHITAPRTRIAYAIDLKVFFEYLVNTNPLLAGKSTSDVTLDILSNLTSYDIEEYLEHLKIYNKDGQVITNNERGIKRKISSLRSFYNYMYKNHAVTANPAIQVSLPKLHEKAIVRLDANETADLLDCVEYGFEGTSRQEAFHKKTRLRDLAMITLMLGTGIRVSECVGLDIQDVDFNNDRIKVTRKGGSEAYVYFGDEVRTALQDYLQYRSSLTPKDGHQQALFLSSQMRRITVRATENLVKKYATASVSLKKITPHKLRSTYGTSLYQETGDIYLVADVLGHKDVNTTRRHYAAIEEERRRYAKDKVHLRKD